MFVMIFKKLFFISYIDETCNYDVFNLTATICYLTFDRI